RGLFGLLEGNFQSNSPDRSRERNSNAIRMVSAKLSASGRPAKGPAGTPIFKEITQRSKTSAFPRKTVPTNRLRGFGILRSATMAWNEATRTKKIPKGIYS